MTELKEADILYEPIAVHDMVLITALLDKFKTGLPEKVVCNLVGVPLTLFREWMKKGENGFENGQESLYVDLYRRVKNATGTFIEKQHNNVFEKGRTEMFSAFMKMAAILEPEAYSVQDDIKVIEPSVMELVNSMKPVLGNPEILFQIARQDDSGIVHDVICKVAERLHESRKQLSQQD